MRAMNGRPSAALLRPPQLLTRTISRRLSSKIPRALVINAGSSSVKYGLFDVGASEEARVSGLVEKIGLDGSSISHTGEDGIKQKIEVALPDHATALNHVVELLTASGGPIGDVREIDVVGHRVVHGGASMTTPTVIDDSKEALIESCIPLAPLHNPANLLGIRVARSIFPAPHVAVFDTAFHSTMPPESYTYALPRELIEEHGVRRYGFHGTSYTYVLQKTAEILGRPANKFNAIICHLGSGASMSAVLKGKCVDTTMGLTPLEGLVMGTRAGDLDAGVLSFLSGHLGKSQSEIDTLLNKRSGLLGLSGTSDWRNVREQAQAGDQNAALARSVFIERIRKYLGAYLVKLNGELDALVFTGGIGENDPGLREAVCEGLSSFGLAVDQYKNQMGLHEVQPNFAKVRTLVVPTNEELSIAMQSAEATGLFKAASAPRPVASTDAAATGATVKDAQPGATLHTEAEVLMAQAAKVSREMMAEEESTFENLGHALFIESDGPTGLIEAALLSAVLPRVTKLGYFRLLSYGKHYDAKLDFITNTDKFNLQYDSRDSMIGITVDEALHLFAQSGGQSDEIFSKIIDSFNAYAKDKDFVIVSGEKITARGAGGAPGSSTFYAKLQSALNLPSLVVHDVESEGVKGEGLEAELLAIKASKASENVRFAGAMITGLPLANYAKEAEVMRAMLQRIDIPVAGVMPTDSRVSQLTMAEVATALDAKVLYGSLNLDRQSVHNIEIATM